MRATLALKSDAPTGKSYNIWWGDTHTVKQRGIVQYALSPWRQRPMKGAFNGYIFNGYRRIAGHLPYVVLPFAIGYGVYTWGNKTYAFNNSKAGHIAHGGHH